MVIPAERLPPGFADGIERPPSRPAEPKPAATAVLVRDGERGPEVLLLRRHRQSGFVPGAYVFPGGRVDAADGDDALRDWCATEPAPEHLAAYALAAIREVFEETGVLLARSQEATPPPDATADEALAEWREALLSDRATLLDVVRATGRRLDAAALLYCAHWITPAPEPRRYDTRFFLAPLPRGCTTSADAREMTDERWLRPEDALAAFHEGRLPMVFPTVRTLEQLSGFTDVAAVLDAFRGRAVLAVEPRLVRTPDGVGIVVD
jgi:8-oxo-dGTP pyrophosphatase MutT (NUDIX family)